MKLGMPPHCGPQAYWVLQKLPYRQPSRAGLDLPFFLELLVVRVIPTVVAVGLQPPLPPLPVELPAGRAAVLDGLDEAVVVLGR